MKNKYQKLFWVYFGTENILTLSIFIYLFWSDAKYPESLFPVFDFLLVPLISFFIFLFLCQIHFGRMSSLLRNNLPFEEYFKLKKSLQISLDKKDKKYASQQITDKDLKRFLYNFTKLHPLSKCDMVIYYAFVALSILAVLIHPQKLDKSTQIRLIISYCLILIYAASCNIFVFKPIKNRFLFAKKVDELVEAEEIKNHQMI